MNPVAEVAEILQQWAGAMYTGAPQRRFEVRGSNERSPHTVLTWIVLSIALLRCQRRVITGAAFRQASRQRRREVDALLQGSEWLDFNEVA